MPPDKPRGTTGNDNRLYAGGGASGLLNPERPERQLDWSKPCEQQ
jgi:hypothetical protein